MSVVSSSAALRTSGISGARLERMLFVGTVALAGMLLWIAPRPGMGDLAQHAAQVAMLHDLISGTSRWSDLVRINLFTPYLLGYVVALGLSFVMPVVAALKLVMMLAFYGYVAAGIKMRQVFNADARLDWLYIPGFFGFSYQYGFYSFLIAVPIGFLFLVLARRFAQSPGVSNGTYLLLTGVGLFFSHGLVFLLALAIGAAFIPFLCKTRGRFIAALVPYALLGMLALAYYIALHHNDLLVAKGVAESIDGAEWDWLEPYGWHRAATFLLYTLATQKDDLYFLPAAVFLLAAPWLMGARPNWADKTAIVPLVAVLLVWFAMPSQALGTMFLYHRFAIFLLPVYALAFREGTPGERQPSAGRRPGWDRSLLTRAAVVVFCWFYLGLVGVREHRFAVASASFETVLAAAEPGQRALSLVYAPGSEAIHNPYTYHTFPVWYQVDKGGFVDFNFAAFLPQIVRFRPDRVPAMRPDMENDPKTFDWHAVQGRVYRYFFVRHTEPLPAGLFKNDECDVALVKEAGEWSLFERRSCR
jgi:hypothetical protein